MLESKYTPPVSSSPMSAQAKKQSDMEKAMEATLKSLPLSSSDATSSIELSTDGDDLKARQAEKFRLLLVDKVRCFIVLLR